jgi:hypothetical protein
MKIRPVGVQLFHAGGRTDRPNDMTKLAFRVDASRPPVYGLEYGLNIWLDFLKFDVGGSFKNVFEEARDGEIHLCE